ncbi:hypothetical protein [Streptomyces sp. NPDC059063]|uniref:hypothetical protein n=1 Tax=unclassified Streptomyces TaxID=2593676 RepID=UPI00367892B3
MTAVHLAPHEVARWALRAGLPLEGDRLDGVTATAQHIHAVVSTLRELDFGEVPPAFAYAAASSGAAVSSYAPGEEAGHGAV